MVDVPFIIYIVLSLPLIFLGDVLRDHWGFRPDLTIIFITALAFSGRGRLAPLFGLILGLILDNLNVESTFTYALGYFCAGLAISYIRSRFLRKSLLFRCVILMLLIEGFRLYMILVGSLHYGHLVFPEFHPGFIAPGIFLSLLIFIPLTLLLDKLIPVSRWEDDMGEVFLR